ncbi:MAG: ATP-binding cassette domain-containing protein [Candidatus Kapabacteria bacterium]|nr:ATP-binding cassette domain-containing protein [Candidatus Kapabacteria bacterium]
MIQIKDFHKVFNRGTINEVYALKNINLEVEDGDFITIIGTNGSGKSTLLNAISGTFIGDEGSVKIADVDVTFMPEHSRAKHIARVFQNPFSGTAPGMSIAENLHLAALRGKTRMPILGLGTSKLDEYKAIVKDLEMQLEDRLDNFIGSLSGGQRQAITLLMAVMTKPNVLLLDEHTAALDPKSASLIINLTKKFVEQYNLTTVMVTHSMQQALALGNKTIMMYRGEIIESLSMKDKQNLTADDLLDKFAELRKNEKLNPEIIMEFSKEY